MRLVFPLCAKIRFFRRIVSPCLGDSCRGEMFREERRSRDPFRIEYYYWIFLDIDDKYLIFFLSRRDIIIY